MSRVETLRGLSEGSDVRQLRAEAIQVHSIGILPEQVSPKTRSGRRNAGVVTTVVTGLTVAAAVACGGAKGSGSESHPTVPGNGQPTATRISEVSPTSVAPITSTPEATATPEAKAPTLEELTGEINKVTERYPNDEEAQKAKSEIEEASRRTIEYKNDPVGNSISYPLSSYARAAQSLASVACANPDDSDTPNVWELTRNFIKGFALDNVGADQGQFTLELAQGILEDDPFLQLPPDCSNSFMISK